MFTIIPDWHPVFVHFTVALLSITALFHVLVMFMRPSGRRDELPYSRAGWVR